MFKILLLNKKSLCKWQAKSTNLLLINGPSRRSDLKIIRLAEASLRILESISPYFIQRFRPPLMSSKVLEGKENVPHLMKLLEMWRFCPLLIIISCLLWGRENSHLSLPATQAVSPEQVSECVHSWDRLIKWGWLLTINLSWKIISSLSPGKSAGPAEQHQSSCLMPSCADCGGRARGMSRFFFSFFFFGRHKSSRSLLSEGRVSNSLICFNGAPALVCVRSVPVLATPGGPLNRNSKSGHLTAGHFTAETLTHTSNPGSSLPNLPSMDTKTVACYGEIAL